MKMKKITYYLSMVCVCGSMSQLSLFADNAKETSDEIKQSKEVNEKEGKIVPPPAIDGASIWINTTSSSFEKDKGHWIVVKMKNNKSGEVQGVTSTEKTSYLVESGKISLEIDWTEHVGSMPRIFNYSINGDAPAEELESSEEELVKPARVTIHSVEGKEYRGFLNGYLHNWYNCHSEELKNAPVIIVLK